MESHSFFVGISQKGVCPVETLIVGIMPSSLVAQAVMKLKINVAV